MTRVCAPQTRSSELLGQQAQPVSDVGVAEGKDQGEPPGVARHPRDSADCFDAVIKTDVPVLRSSKTKPGAADWRRALQGGPHTKCNLSDATMSLYMRLVCNKSVCFSTSRPRSEHH